MDSNLNALEQSSDAMIRTVDMRVDYDDMTAVRDMNLTINQGEVFGLIGPNGAGKTSTIRVLATLQEPTYGDVFVGGVDIAEHPDKVHEILGYMPDMAPVYDELKVWEFLDLFAAAHFVTKSRRMDLALGRLWMPNGDSSTPNRLPGLRAGGKVKRHRESGT